MKRKILIGIFLMVLILPTALAFNPFSLDDWYNLIQGIFGLSSESTEPFTILEYTERDIKEDTVYLAIKDNLGKDQIINVSSVFKNDSLTRDISYKDILLHQSYQEEVHELINVSLGKYKTASIIEECEYEYNNQTHENKTVNCVDISHYYDDSQDEMFCDFILADKSCLVERMELTGYETKYAYLPIPNLKEKVVIDGKKIEQKQEGIPLPKNSMIYLKYTVKHPIAFRIDIPDDVNKYNITVTSADGSEKSILDPDLFDEGWGRCKNLVHLIGGFNRVNESVSVNITGLTCSNCTKELRIVNESCGVDGSIVDFDFIQSDQTSWAHINYPFTNTSQITQNYSAYYDYASATYDPEMRLYNTDVWDNYYNATVEPMDANAAWNKDFACSPTTSGVVFDKGYVRFNASENCTNVAEQWTNTRAATSGSATFEASVRFQYWDSAEAQFIIADGAERFYFQMHATQLNEKDTATLIVNMDTVSDYFVMRVMMKSGNATVWINNDPKVTSIDPDNTGWNLIRVTPTMNAGSIGAFAIDYITWVDELLPPIAVTLGTEEAPPPPPNSAPQFFNNVSNYVSPTYTPSRNYGFEINWTDNNLDDVIFETNFTGSFANTTVETISDLKHYTNFTQEQFKGAYLYNYRWHGNDSASPSLTNQTDWIVFEINKAVYNITVDGVVNGTYPVSETVYITSNATSSTLERNGTDVTSENNTAVTLPAGLWNYTGSIIGNENITATSMTAWNLIDKASTSTSCSLSPASPITYEIQTTAYCYSNSSESNCVLERNSTDVTATENNTALYLPTGLWNHTCSVSATENYTASSQENSYTINTKDADVQVYPSTATETYPYNASQYCTDGSSLLDCKIYRNDTEITNNTNYEGAAGVYIYKANITDQTNYTNYDDTETLTIIKANPNVTISGVTNGTYPVSETVYITSDNETEVTITLERNGTDVTSENNTAVTLPAGLWNYTGYVAGNENITAATVTVWNLINQNTLNSVSISGVTNGTYPISQTIFFTVVSNISSATFERNGTDITAENNTAVTLPAGLWNYTVFSAGNENYTSAMITAWNQINQQGSLTNLYLNGTESNTLIYPGERLNLTAVLNISQTVYIDTNITGWVIVSGTPSIENISQINTIGTYNITGYFPGNENYTLSSATHYVTVVSPSYAALNETYNKNVTEGDTEYFEIFVNTTGVSDVNATFYYNETSYSVTETEYEVSSSNSHYKFSKNLVTPLISLVSENVTFNFTYTVFFFNGSSVTNGTDHTQTINKIYITNCSAGGTIAMKINIFDESDRSNLNATIELAFDLWKENQNLIENYSFILQGHDNYSICIFPSHETYRMNAFMEARNLPAFPRRHRWLFNVSLSNTTQTVDIYLLNTTYATFMYMYVQDQSGQAEEDILVQVQRYYISADAYILVAEGLSNFDGLANTYLQLNDIYYKFILKTKEGVIQRTFDPFLVTDDELTLPITDDPIGDWFDFNEESSYACSYNNNTRYLSCSFSDTSGTSTNHCLGVSQVGVMINTTICEESSNCESTASGTLTCYLADNTTGKVYQYILVRYGSEAVVTAGILDFTILAAIYGLSGVFVTLILFLTLSFIGSYSPAASLFLGVVAFIIAYITRILSISLGSIIGLSLMVGIILYLMKTR